jgi:hypothetical protein
MIMWLPKGSGGAKHSVSSPARAGLIVGLVLSTAAMTPSGASSAPAAALPDRADAAAAAPASDGRYTLSLKHKAAIPAFARKYSLACSACHTTWPELNNFGQVFKDNGYQLMNEKDSPIQQSNSYWPIAVRTTPQWHMESTTNQPIDNNPGGTPPGLHAGTVTAQGFDLSGVDFLMMGTLYKNISFQLVTTLDPDGSAGIEAANVRFDNINNSPWFNVKFGKFELDNMISEKRGEFLSNNGGLYQNYHFNPVNSSTPFGFGDNQLGIELMGHNKNSYTRYTLSLLSTTDGEPGLPPGSGKGVDVMFTLSHAWAVQSLGLMRVGIFGVLGQQSTIDQTSNGEPIGGTGSDNKPFSRIGINANLTFGDLEVLPYYMHGVNNSALNTAGLTGPQDATWNAAILEAHYVVNPRLVFMGKWQNIKVTNQFDPAAATSGAGNQGNIDGLALGLRSYFFMFSRDGLALHVEYAYTNSVGIFPLSGDGLGDPGTPLPSPLTEATTVKSSSLLIALDFAF